MLNSRRGFLKHAAVAAAAPLLANQAISAEPTKGKRVSPPANQHGTETTFFAFDDQSLAWQHNLKLTLVTPEKHPANPVVRCGPKGSRPAAST